MKESQTNDISVKDLVALVLKKAGAVVLTGVIASGLCVGLTAVRNLTVSDKEDKPGVLDIENMLDGETEEQYASRVRTVERANALVDNIATLNVQSDKQNNYLASSILMQLDPVNTASSSVQILIDSDNDDIGLIGSLCTAYENAMVRGDYLEQMAGEYGTQAGFIQELIRYSDSVGGSNSDLNTVDLNSMLAGSETGMIYIVVVGPDTVFTDSLLEQIIDRAVSLQDEFSEQIVNHSISFAGRSNTTGYDPYVNETQLTTLSAINTIQTQINNNNKSLDDIATSLGLKSRNDLLDSANLTSTSKYSKLPYGKYAGVGLVIGLFAALAFVVLQYFWGRKIVTQTQFFSIFGGIDKIGVCKPQGKRSGLRTALDKMTDDDSRLSEENTNKLIAHNFRNSTLGMNKVLVTGFADKECVDKLMKDMGVNADVKLDIFGNPDILGEAGKYDGIVLVEQRGVTLKKEVSEEVRLLGNSGSRIVGAIIL